MVYLEGQFGVLGGSYSPSGFGVYGLVTAEGGAGVGGINFKTTANGLGAGSGVWGVTFAGAPGAGVYGSSTNIKGVGVYGAVNALSGYGVGGYNAANDGYGVYAVGATALRADSTNSGYYSGYFTGGKGVYVQGTVEATRFKGDGSQLTNLPSSSLNPPITLTRNNGAYFILDNTDSNASDWTIKSYNQGLGLTIAERYHGAGSNFERFAIKEGGNIEINKGLIVGGGSTFEGNVAVSKVLKIAPANDPEPWRGMLNIGGTNTPLIYLHGVKDIGWPSDGFLQLGTINKTNGTWSEKMVITDTGNVGIGTSTPSQKLDVQGNAHVSGNVGIGTSTPSQKLDVQGNAHVSGNVGIGTSTPNAKLSVNGDVYIGGKIRHNIVKFDKSHFFKYGNRHCVDIGSATVGSISRAYVDLSDNYILVSGTNINSQSLIIVSPYFWGNHSFEGIQGPFDGPCPNGKAGGYVFIDLGGDQSTAGVNFLIINP